MTDIEKHNTKALETLLLKKLKEMARCLDIALDDWHLDKSLFRAFIKSKNLKKMKKKAKDYDDLYEVAKVMGVRNYIDPSYSWFYQIFKK
jgi:hypothetical protein